MIGIDGHVLGDKSGGNETYYRNLINYLSDEIQKETILFVSPELDMEMYNYHGKVVRFESTNSFVRNFIEIPKLCKRYELDCMHMQYFIPFRRPCKMIATIHDISFEHFSDIFTKKEMFIQKTLIPYAARKSDTILTVSEYSKKDICEHYHIPEDKVVVTYNGKNDSFRDLNMSKEEIEKLCTSYQIPNDYILYVGNIQPRKNLKRLLQAYVKYAKQCAEFKPLVIVGKKAWMYEAIFEEIKEQKLEEYVYFTGYVKEEDLVKLYSVADFFVYPSIFEGFGLPPLEAMACGTPVITSNNTSIPEVTGNACKLIDPYSVDEICDALIQFTVDEQIKAEYAKKGLEQAKKFSWKNTAQQTEAVYRKYLKK